VAADVRRSRAGREVVAYLVGFGSCLLLTGWIISEFEKPYHAFHEALPKNPVVMIVVWALEIALVLVWLAVVLSSGEYVAQHFTTLGWWVGVLVVAGCVLGFVVAFVVIVIGLLRAPKRDRAEGGGLSEG
jgi:hypothetical protein